MPIPEQRDLEVARKSIQDWLGGRRPGAQGLTVSELVGPGATGFSNETLLFDVTWREDGHDRRESLVLRVKPTGYRVFMEDDFELQYRVLEELGTQGVRVPPVREFESDPAVLGAPFFLMQRVEGQVPGDAPPYNAEGFVKDMPPADRRRLWESAMDALIEVHRAGLDGGFAYLAKPHRGPTGFDQQLRYYEEALAWAAQGRPQPVAEAAWEWLSGHLPEERPTALSWGDARIANMIFDGCTCRAVLDWEMVSLGGPEMDLGWWLFLDRFSAEGNGLVRLEGLGTREETVARWEEGTGLRARNLEFYEIFAGLRFAVVMMRLAQMFKQWELPVPEDMETNNAVTHLLAELLDMEPPGPRPSYS
ncbi:MAG TPA: phosphotransferase family protein [Acidimicrobiales bacterium]|nr:phosphotransferase family protein [Acidimicrobiales bacterium]